MWRGVGPGGSELVAECEAFLNGRFAEHLIEIGEPVPPWAWVNLLAHGTVAQLRDPSTVDPEWPGRLRPWLHARAYVAGEVLDAAQRLGSLARLQRDVLVPLELSLIQQCRGPVMRPSEWAATVLAAIEPQSTWRRAGQLS